MTSSNPNSNPKKDTLNPSNVVVKPHYSKNKPISNNPTTMSKVFS